ncbi:hypothetical protein B4N89_44820 [Embleya scabrispora]|uniref:DUF3825 domain-containing protein n=1 Tax=Embleya scabrispora TaxID=159449 RepID=A0A1T3NIK3_9ACTN|nr:DUF3825 domain-containing protein [Embleya scabrispora]OPC76618.1 hypothetical protein B4N89_44820 [Embleya scabrispora]
MSEGRPSATPADLAVYKQQLASNGAPPPPPAGRPKAPDRALYAHAHLGRIRSAAERRAGEGDPDVFDRLAELAENEDWDGRDPNFRGEHRILRAYVEWTFERAHLQGRVLTGTDERFGTFNTGLATREQEDIFGLFEVNRVEGRQPWYFRGWRVESDRDFLKNFPTPPEPVTFTEDPSAYHYDWTRELKVNVRHVMEDNLDRFPRALRTDLYGLELRLEAAVKRAAQRAKRNYKAAVPMWYPKADEVQLLLPLSLTHPHTVDLALVVSRHGEHYRGNTVLTMGMAYSNARLLARPDGDWLQPAADSSETPDVGHGAVA